MLNSDVAPINDIIIMLIGNGMRVGVSSSHHNVGSTTWGWYGAKMMTVIGIRYGGG